MKPLNHGRGKSHLAWIALLEIRAAAAADQQVIAGKNFVVDQEGGAGIGMTWRAEMPLSGTPRR
jgi:hypothetical protein